MHGTAAADHQLQLAQGSQVVQRVLPGHDEISALPRFNGAGHIPHTGQPGIAQGGRVESKLVAHAAVFVEVAQLPPEIMLPGEYQNAL